MGYVPVAIGMSSGFEAANNLAIEGANDATTWLPLKTASGGAVAWTSGVITSATGAAYGVATEWQHVLSGYQFLRFRANGNQSTGVTFNVQLIPL
jgi:hypothetical protein